MITEDMYYIANIVKCRPPSNRVPFEQEAQQCLPYLREQVRLVQPKIVVCLGATAIKYIVDKGAMITKFEVNGLKENNFG